VVLILSEGCGAAAGQSCVQRCGGCTFNAEGQWSMAVDRGIRSQSLCVFKTCDNDANGDAKNESMKKIPRLFTGHSNAAI
jgi:hypothetical protein